MKTVSKHFQNELLTNILKTLINELIIHCHT